jgi:hypothetical protein
MSLKHPTLVSEPLVGARKELKGAFVENPTVQQITDPSMELRKSREFAPVTFLAHSGDADEQVYADRSGFVSMAITAYNTHHDLVLRPDDVWLAIMAQFAYYVTANAEKLRDKFVAHNGQQQITVHDEFSFEAFLHVMRTETQANIKDPTVVDWMIPSFSTTTDTDVLVATVTTMAAMQKYFSFKMCLACGIPSVELLGTVEDWEQLSTKVDRLTEFSVESDCIAKWHQMLKPVVAEMVRTRKGENNIDWWQKIAHRKAGGSGPRYLAGWITVFAVFSDKGEWQGDVRRPWYADEHDEDSEYPLVDTEDIPSGIVSRPVLFDDNGVEFKCHLFAGHFAHTTTTGKDLRPCPAWCLTVEPAHELF